MAGGTPTRRQVLGAVATGGLATLAGCSPVVYDDYLTLDVPEIRERDGRFVGRYVVRNTRPSSVTPASGTTDEPREYATAYEGVRFLGFDPDGDRTVTVDIGDLDPETRASGEFEAPRFPLVITADADGVSVEGGDNYHAESGAPVDGYFGRYDDPERSPSGETGHVWQRLARRRLPASEPDPVEARLLDRLKCRHRRLRREGRPPNLDLVPNSDDWVHREIPEPTIHERHWITAGSDLESDAYHPPETVELPFEGLPPLVRQSLREGRNPPWLDRERFLAVASEVTGDRYRDVDELPPCSADHVVCNDDRRENCRSGGGRFVGGFGKYAWYETAFEGTRRGVVVGYEERWKPPDAEPLGPCSGDRNETFTVRTTDGPNRIAGLEDGKRVEPVPSVAQWYLDQRSEDDSYSRSSPDATAFERLIDALDEPDDGRFPSCERSHVRCFRDPRVHCGRGRRKLFYQLPEGDELRGLVATYEWTGTSE